MLYLTGSSNEHTRAAGRSDLGLLGTPAGSTVAQRGHYGTWAADNGMFAAPEVDGSAWLSPILGEPCFMTPTARAVRYGSDEPLILKWHAWLQTLETTDCLFATMPDVVGDYAATWERNSHYIERVRALGFPIALVMQDGLENDRFIWRSMLEAADVLFIGGSTEWKVGPECAALVAEAKAAGKWVHMGRVNSLLRLRYAQSIGCDSADGTYVAFGPAKNTPKLLGWLDALNGEQVAA